MVAIGPSTSDGFAASITLTESELADLALGRLVRVSRSVSLLRRSTPGSAITKAVRLTTSIRGVEWEVVQCHAFVPVSEGRVMEAVLTTTPAQFGQVIGEFVGSIEADI
jgi:hypothetical protein